MGRWEWQARGMKWKGKRTAMRLFDSQEGRMASNDCRIDNQAPLVIPPRVHRFQKTLLSAFGLN